jgi:hypothetical protein
MNFLGIICWSCLNKKLHLIFKIRLAAAREEKIGEGNPSPALNRLAVYMDLIIAT